MSRSSIRIQSSSDTSSSTVAGWENGFRYVVGVTHSKERSFACRSRPRCVTLSVDLSSVNYERYSGDAGKSVNSGDRSGGLCVRDVD